MISNANEAYWYASSTSKFNFDENEEKDTFSVDLIIPKKCLDLLLLDIETQNIYAVPPVEEVIKKMMLGHKYILEVYKSYKDKELLLEEALKTGDGDIILRVVVYLRNTLKFNIFCRLMIKQTVALIQYSNLLKMKGNLDELENLYMATGFTSNIRDIFFLNKRNSISKEKTLTGLKCFISSHSELLNKFNEKKILSEYVKFLEWQIAQKRNANSVVEQLAILCKEKFEKNSNYDIVEFKNLFQIGDVQYEWTVMNCLCYLGLWIKLKEMFIKPNWLTKKNSLKTAITYENLIYGISRHNPPKNVLEEFLVCLNDSETALALAEEYKCYKYIIEYYIGQKDRLGLLSYRDKVTYHSEEYYLISKAIEDRNKKWKN